MTSDRLTLVQIILLLAYALAMAGGQLLFKLAALRFASEKEGLSGVLQNGYFVAAIVLYATLAIVWVWILTFTPLSRAYPFVALAFAVTPMMGIIIFGETSSYQLLAGIVLVVSGLALIMR